MPIYRFFELAFKENSTNSLFYKVSFLDIECSYFKNSVIFFLYQMCLFAKSALSWRSHEYLVPLFDKMPQKICVDSTAIDIVDF